MKSLDMVSIMNLQYPQIALEKNGSVEIFDNYTELLYYVTQTKDFEDYAGKWYMDIVYEYAPKHRPHYHQFAIENAMDVVEKLGYRVVRAHQRLKEEL